MDTGQRRQVLIYLVMIGLNLLVLPRWFSPGRFGLGTRLVFIGVQALLIALCAWQISRVMGVNPFSKLKHPVYIPYQGSDDEEPEIADTPPMLTLAEDPEPPYGEFMATPRTAADLRIAVQRYYDALDQDDLDAVLEGFSGDVLYRRPGYDTIVGIDQLRSYYAEERRLAPGRHLLRDVLVEENRVAAHGAYEGRTVDGEQTAVGFAAFFVFDANGRISEHTTFFFIPAV
ncbi:hypothetical protein KEM60_00933 [Austwickia sp. TVS 96-490-7B]|uniref:nuclear transport factor 2 family protein n=1 Tax=Austwickia sp. TVS 96-490-7B TaxID=2830843 RepID=UPI001D60500B|nr:nuclear transport factor 2 family protein [Austwickia sp. TVS 96-490-7B]MBW3084744.1 hypothetical protein [Austwickia sp. TVS 96-490-7B]